MTVLNFMSKAFSYQELVAPRGMIRQKFPDADRVKKGTVIYGIWNQVIYFR